MSINITSQKRIERENLIIITVIKYSRVFINETQRAYTHKNKIKPSEGAKLFFYLRNYSVALLL